MKNIWIVPTKKESDLFLGNLRRLVPITIASAKTNKPVFVYITSDDKVKHNEWFINTLTKVVSQYNGIYINLLKGDKKIILTNDPELINNGIQKIPYTLIEWYSNNPVSFISKEQITELIEQNDMLIERGIKITEFTSEGEKPKGYTTVIRKLENGQKIEWQNCFYDNGWYDKSGCRIPNVIKWKKQIVENPKTETVEEAINRISQFKGYDIEGGTLADFVDGFVEGVKWFSEQKQIKD